MDRLPVDKSDWSQSPIYADGGAQQVDRILDALGTYRRRCALYHLVETDPTELEKVTRVVSAMETGQPPDDVPAEVLDDVKADLYHNTLPKLAELNVIEYDQRSETIRYGHPPPRLEEFLELTRDLDSV